LMSFMARKGRPSDKVPRSCTGGMAGCCNWAVMRASSAKRRATSESGVYFSCSTLTATSRPSAVSVAR
jgi:hypothetical protein